ncbi:MAG: ExbD/TolR family protein [Lautropia sp.]
MAFGGPEDGDPLAGGPHGRGAPLAEINMVPLIDVMLVLLVIFMITAPLMTHSVALSLPRASAAADAFPVRIDVAIDAQGNRFIDGEPVTRETAAARFAALRDAQPQPVIHLRADREVAYERVAETIADAARAGLTRIAFVSVPQ